MIIIEDYWSPGKIIDTFADNLTDKDRKYIEEIGNITLGGGSTDEMGNWDESKGWVYKGNKEITNPQDIKSSIYFRCIYFQFSV